MQRPPSSPRPADFGDAPDFGDAESITQAFARMPPLSTSYTPPAKRPPRGATGGGSPTPSPVASEASEATTASPEVGMRVAARARARPDSGSRACVCCRASRRTRTARARGTGRLRRRLAAQARRPLRRASLQPGQLRRQQTPRSCPWSGHTKTRSRRRRWRRMSSRNLGARMPCSRSPPLLPVPLPVRASAGRCGAA